MNILFILYIPLFWFKITKRLRFVCSNVYGVLFPLPLVFVHVGFGDEVGLELRNNMGVPENCTRDFSVDFVWKSTSFDRMQNALKRFAVDDSSVTGYLYHRLLGRDIKEMEEVMINTHKPLPKQ